MPSSPSALLNVELQATGENLNTWGGLLNGTINRLTEAIAQVTTVAVTSPTTTLTATNYVANQARSAGLLFTGVLTADTVVVAPSQTKIYLISNGTTGAFNLSINTLAGTPLAIRNGSIPYFVYCDGTNFVSLDLTLNQIRTAAANVAMGTHKFTGMLKGSATGDSASLDNALSDFLGTVAANIPMSNFTFTGLPAASASGRPVTLANSLDQLTAPAANVDFNSRKITSLADGSASSQDAASVQQVQNLIAAAVVPAGNGMVRIDAADTTNGFLDAKLVPSSIMQRTIGNVGANETYIFDAKTFVGATSGVGGTRGVVPAPIAGQQTSFLRGDATWGSAFSTPNPITGAAAIGTTARGTDVQWGGAAGSPTVAAGTIMGACSFNFQNTNDGRTLPGAALLTMAAGDTIDGRPSIYVYPGEGFKIDGPGGSNAAWTTSGRARKGGRVLIQEQAITAVAAIDFTLGFPDTEITSMEFEYDVTALQSTTLALRVSIAGTFQTGASYAYSNLRTTSNTTATTVASSNVDTLLTVGGFGNPGPLIGKFVFANYVSTSIYKSFRFESAIVDSNPFALRMTGSGAWVGSQAALDGIRIMQGSAAAFTSGGAIRQYGVRT